jgi:PKD repeat protein
MALTAHGLLHGGLLSGEMLQPPAGGGGGVPNVGPTAAFSSIEVGLESTFTDESTDSDGTITAWDWDFGDGEAHGTTQNPVHEYATSDTYTVTLIVTDDGALTDDIQHDVTVAQRSTITWTDLVTNSSTANAASYATASITPVSDRKVFAACAVAIGSGTSNQPTLTGCGLTWTAVGTVVFGVRRLTVFEAMGTAASGALTFDFAAQTQASIVWAVAQPAGADLVDASVQFKTAVDVGASTGLTCTLDGALENAANHALAFTILGAAAAVTPDADFTPLSADTEVSSSIALDVSYGLNQTVVSPTWSSTFGGIVLIEVKAGLV